MSYRKTLRYAMQVSKIAAACLSVYFMLTKDDSSEHEGTSDDDMDELDKIEQEEISVQN